VKRRKKGNERICSDVGKGGRLSLMHEPLSASPNDSLGRSSRIASPPQPQSTVVTYTDRLSRLHTSYKKMATREASHAGSWYSSRPSILSSELDEWLAQVPASIEGKELPIPGARIIIAP
jgi:hypothetical protein